MADELDQEEMEAAERCGYSKEEALAFKGVFTHFDNTFGKGDGNCNIPLMKSMVRALGVNMGPAEEDRLTEMLDEADENKDGSTQFPEFLILINMMQEQNFCGMNDAAAGRVAQEEEQAKRKAAADERKKKEKEQHKANKEAAAKQKALEAEEQKKQLAEMKAKGIVPGQKEVVVKEYKEEEMEESVLPKYDPATHGEYKRFYYTILKPMLDEANELWQDTVQKKRDGKIIAKVLMD